jgi:tRNA G18 (ribose-2'-O)-methylase SpoU
MGLTTPLGADPLEVRALLAPLRNDFTIALHAADNAFAVGAIIRVAHSFLAREIVIVGDAPYYEKASMGMEKDHATTSLYAVDARGGFPRDVVLLFGSERFGIPEALVRKAEIVVGIPIYGVNHSLPLAVAAGIVMNEWARLKYASGVVVP